MPGNVPAPLNYLTLTTLWAEEVLAEVVKLIS